MRRLLIILLALTLLFATGCSREEPPVPSKTEESSEEEVSESTQLATIETITIPEGYTLARIGMVLEEQGFCSVDEFIEATENVDVSRWPLLADREPDENRCFQLEGYLFPATYDVYSTDPPEEIIRRMLEHTEQQFTDEMRANIEKSPYSIDQILALASIIEKEAFGHSEMPNISSVLHNRLDDGMQLQCDVTINYVEGAIKPFIDGDKDRYSEFYNTYRCAALPAGPICNPSMDAITAALRPAETDYYYFLTDADKNYHYAATFSEHEENIRAAGLTTN